jgi:hypothetical protein
MPHFALALTLFATTSYSSSTEKEAEAWLVACAALAALAKALSLTPLVLLSVVSTDCPPIRQKPQHDPTFMMLPCETLLQAPTTQGGTPGLDW